MQEQNEIQVTLKTFNNFSETRYVKINSTVEEILQQSHIPDKQEMIAAIVNNIYSDLSDRVEQASTICFISLRSRRGLEVYSHTATHILNYIIVNLFGKNLLSIGPSINYNFYFDLETDIKVTKSILKNIEKEFHNIVKSNVPIVKEKLSYQEAKKYFDSLGEEHKIKMLKNLNADFIPCYRIENYREFCHGPLANNTGLIKKFKLIPYPPGFLMVFPKVQRNKLKIDKVRTPKKLSKVFLETRDWYKIQGVSNVQQLNEQIRKDKLSELITVSEALHEKKISQIADEITKYRKEIKLVLIAGPSASGKTTFIKRLMIQLKVNGIVPLAISLDNYFLNRSQTKRDEYGNYDFENIEALDLSLLNEHLVDLVKGKIIQMPEFDFHTGNRKRETIPVKLEKDQIILIEGIHGLNEELTYSISKNRKFKIYVSALSQLRIDNDHRITTTDTRLLRRIVRDYLYRSHSTLDSLKMWPAVRKGEEKNIFPFQEQSDIMFNSALIYEGAVLKTYAEKYLKEVPSHVPEYREAQRLLNVLKYFMECPTQYVPKVSIVREFIGESAFKY